MKEKVNKVLDTIRANGGEAYLVGGCVRDTMLGRTPNDYDIATNLMSEQIKGIFPKTVNEAGEKHLTVTVIIDEVPIEITTYRKDTNYSDGRHPDSVIPAKTIREDLARRDFTINAMASPTLDEIDKHCINLTYAGLVDPYLGLEDLIHKKIKAVGKPRDRLDEDKLRAIRAVRFASQLGFKIDVELLKEIKKTSIHQISEERIQMEFIKILGSPDPVRGFDLLRITGLLEQTIPKLLEGINVGGGEHHKETVWEHALMTLKASTEVTKDWRLRLACLFHDIGKPRCKTDDESIHFYQHENVGADMAKTIMKRLKFSNSDVDYVTKMIKHHMHTAYKTGDKLSKRTIKNLVRAIGEENVMDMIILNYADREGNQAKDNTPFRLFVENYSIWNQWEEIRKADAVLKVTDLKVNGHDMMKLGYKGCALGMVLKKMLNEIDLDKLKNDKKELMKFAKENELRYAME